MLDLDRISTGPDINGHFGICQGIISNRALLSATSARWSSKHFAPPLKSHDVITSANLSGGFQKALDPMRLSLLCHLWRVEDGVKRCR